MSVKLQPRLPVLIVSAGFSLTGVSEKLPMLVALSMKPGKCALEVDDFNAKLAACVSIRSTSANVTVPEVARLRFGATESSVRFGVVLVADTMLGASLVPVSVTVTSCVTAASLLSVIVTV